MQYGLALFRSWSRAIESASNLQESTGKKIQDEIRSTFDAELKNVLQKTDFSKSLSDVIDSFTEFASTLHHDIWLIPPKNKCRFYLPHRHSRQYDPPRQ